MKLSINYARKSYLDLTSTKLSPTPSVTFDTC